MPPSFLPPLSLTVNFPGQNKEILAFIFYPIPMMQQTNKNYVVLTELREQEHFSEENWLAFIHCIKKIKKNKKDQLKMKTAGNEDLPLVKGEN